MIEYGIALRPVRTVPNRFGGVAYSDDIPSAQRIRVELKENAAMKKWSWRALHDESGSKNLNGDYHLQEDDPLYFKFQTFSKGSPTEIKWMVLQAVEVVRVDYDYGAETIAVVMKPAPAAKTANNQSEDQVGMGIDFYYNGVSEDLPHGPHIIVTDAYLDDVTMASHPSSADLQGTAFRVDGLDGERVAFDFIVGQRFVDVLGVGFEQLTGRVDGVVPAAGFTIGGPMDPGGTVAAGSAGEVFRRYSGANDSWSPHDIQLGVFPQPLAITSVDRRDDGFQFTWSATAGKTYTVEATDSLDAPFAPAATNQPGPEFTDPTGAPRRFYRVREE